MTERRDPLRREIRRRAWSAILQYALFRWESAVLIGLTLVLSVVVTHPFEWWPWWGWLALGAVGEVLIVVTSATDEVTGQQVVADMFREQHNPARLRDERYRNMVERALAYRQGLVADIARRKDGALRHRLEEQVRQIDAWVDGIYRLTGRLEELETDALLRQDMATAPGELRRLTERLQGVKDAATERSLRDAQASRQSQVDNLNALRDIMERAHLQLENTLAALGAVYAQVQLLTAKDLDSARARQLQTDIAEQVRAVQDVVDAMDEVYGRARPQAG
jgi:hypothetical protein